MQTNYGMCFESAAVWVRQPHHPLGFGDWIQCKTPCRIQCPLRESKLHNCEHPWRKKGTEFLADAELKTVKARG